MTWSDHHAFIWPASHPLHLSSWSPWQKSPLLKVCYGVSAFASWIFHPSICEANKFTWNRWNDNNKQTKSALRMTQQSQVLFSTHSGYWMSAHPMLVTKGHPTTTRDSTEEADFNNVLIIIELLLFTDITDMKMESTYTAHTHNK